MRLGANVWLVRTGRRVILVDAGSGTALLPTYPETGRLNRAVEYQLLDPMEVTDVVLTHMHADHIGGLMDNGRPRYPRAKVHLCTAEWRFWTDPSSASRLAPPLRPLAGLVLSLADRLAYDIEFHEGPVEVAPGVRLFPAPGHTPGHVAVHLSSGDRQAMLLGDLVLSQNLQFAHPDVSYVLDADPDGAAKVRRMMFDMIVDDAIAFSATHLNTSQFLTLHREGDGFTAQPAQA